MTMLSAKFTVFGVKLLQWYGNVNVCKQYTVNNRFTFKKVDKLAAKVDKCCCAKIRRGHI